jgi:hypothetical protein
MTFQSQTLNPSEKEQLISPVITEWKWVSKVSHSSSFGWMYDNSAPCRKKKLLQFCYHFEQRAFVRNVS